MKAFGERMVQDHTQANNKLMAIAQSKGVQLPTTPNDKDEHTLEHLQSLSGTAFDKAYADHMVRDHKADVKEFEHAARSAADPDVKAFAKATLPTLKEHLSLAENLPSERQSADAVTSSSDTSHSAARPPMGAMAPR